MEAMDELASESLDEIANTCEPCRNTPIDLISPGKNAVNRNIRLHLLHTDNHSYKLEDICTASIMRPLPTFQYLGNIIHDEETRERALNEIFTLIQIESLSLYPNFVFTALVQRPTVNPDLIPPLYPSLRKWIVEVCNKNSSTLPNLFLCVTKSDPLSDPNFYALYNNMDKVDKKSLSNFLRQRISEWNISQHLLAQVLQIALMKGFNIVNPHSDYIALLNVIKTAFHQNSNRLVFVGSVMFWSVKDTLHRDPNHSAQQIKQQINECEMQVLAHAENTPSYIAWIRNVYTLAENLEEYDRNGMSGSDLLELFIQKYRKALNAQFYPYDPILRQYNAGELTWKILTA